MKTEMYNVYRTNGMTGDNIMKIKPNDVMIRYTGRIDWTDAEKPVWVYPCTSAEMKFTGNTLKIKVSNRNNYWDNYLGCIIDQSQRSYLLNKEGITELDIVVPDNDTNEHCVLFFKRQDACHEVTILEYEIGDGGETSSFETAVRQANRGVWRLGVSGRGIGGCRLRWKGRPSTQWRLFKQLVFVCVDYCKKAESTDS